MTCSQTFDLCQQLGLIRRKRKQSASTLDPKRQEAAVHLGDRAADSVFLRCGTHPPSLLPGRRSAKRALGVNRKWKPFVPLLFSLIGLSVPGAAAGLDILYGQVDIKLQEGADRAGVGQLTNVMACIGNYPTTCRWDAGNGVDMVATDDGAGKLQRIEAGWNNARAASNSVSAGTYHDVCAAIAAMAHPSWTRAKVNSVVSRVMLVKPSTRETIEQSNREGGILIYGDRNLPDSRMRSRPDEAFVQCGAVTD